MYIGNFFYYVFLTFLKYLGMLLRGDKNTPFVSFSFTSEYFLS